MVKKMGRPPLAPGEAKGEYFQLRLTAAERIEYEQAAQRAGQSLSAWIRERLSKAVKRESKRD
jgi:predicted HicB family RNase H-like nuclease